ncbi:MAG TPA: gamma-glutamyltransferase [Caulobacteraceae bacterium]|nr:gamma-glutamyltransferase [Caulobacteraceae bacterium]
MPLIADPYSSPQRPVLQGVGGAVAAAHPLAVAAGQELLLAGGSAVDAAIAAQAVLCVVAPDACGLGGDMFALVHQLGDAEPMAINASGAAPLDMERATDDGANSITTPGIVDGWACLSERWGRRPLSRCLQPAIRLARTGFPISQRLAINVQTQRARLDAGGAGCWDLLALEAGAQWRQEALAQTLEAISDDGAMAFYGGAIGAAIVRAVSALGGALTLEDMAAHRTPISRPIMASWGSVRLAVQPPVTQGILLALVLTALDRLGPLPDNRLDHALVELTEAAFAYRDRSAEGEALLALDLPIDLERPLGRGGPRAYLHTAGVAVSDASGQTVTSLVSVFDDFGSGVFVPECGMVLNNRAGGFTDGGNAPAPGKRPVHTLAPAMLFLDDAVLGLATPGADGQVQTLAQVIAALTQGGMDLASAVSQARWRSEGGDLLIERGHPATQALTALCHRLRPLEAGDTRFGAVVCAGQIAGAPIALSDWRRYTWSGVV